MDLKKWEGRARVSLLERPALRGDADRCPSAPPEALSSLGVAADVTGKPYISPEVASEWPRLLGAGLRALEIALGYGIVGGALISFEPSAPVRADSPWISLSGPDPRESCRDVLDVPPAPKFDWRELKRWNLSVDAVPPGSIIINREYTLWERNRTAVIVAFFVLVLQALLIVSLAVSRAQRRRVERQLAEQLRIESLVADLSARFVHLPARPDRERNPGRPTPNL